jgi:hypothetical protein
MPDTTLGRGGMIDATQKAQVYNWRLLKRQIQPFNPVFCADEISPVA